MLRLLAGATIQVANLVNYNCDPQEDGNKKKGLLLRLANRKIVKTLLPAARPGGYKTFTIAKLGLSCS